MENREEFSRFSSCRGVAFEIKSKSHRDPFAIPPVANTSSRRSRILLPWGSNSKIVPSSELFQKSMSRTSSHFCDFHEDTGEEEDEEEDFTRIEEGLAPPLPPAGKLEPPPPKKQSSSRLSVILLDQGLFTVYKRLFSVCLVINITALVLAVCGKLPYAKNRATLFSIANIFALVLCRSELFFRGIFWSGVNVLGCPWVPLKVKTVTTSFLQSVGGIHSGCGISSIAWLTYALILTVQDRANTTPEIVAVASAILGLLSLSALAAFPLLRHLHHNVFERTHRFAGWSALILLWVFLVLTISFDPTTRSYSENPGSRLVKRQEFWFTLGITVLIILPWLSLRRVPVKVSSASGHVSIIKFEGGIKAGILGRISPSPFSEWHAFGIISDNKDQHMMLAGAVGDFTKSLVTNPPSHLWVRTVHFAGLPYLANMYNRVLFVATGSGICVFLSFLLQPSRVNVCILWVTKNVEQNFGKEIKEWMNGHPPENVIVHDTAVLGRPDVSKLSVDTAKNFGAEVVIVTSNPEGSRDVVNACKAAKIPAFGPIWDS